VAANRGSRDCRPGIRNTAVGFAACPASTSRGTTGRVSTGGASASRYSAGDRACNAAT
jgi:hypothetical protein